MKYKPNEENASFLEPRDENLPADEKEQQSDETKKQEANNTPSKQSDSTWPDYIALP